MDYSKQLDQTHNKANVKLIAHHVGNDPDRFALLMQLFFDADNRIAQRAAHVVSHCVDAYPSLLAPYIGQMVAHLNTNPKVAIKRNTVRVLQNQRIPEEYQGTLVEKCFEYVASNKEAIAVRAFSMTVLCNMTKIYPELKNELILVVEEAIENGSPGLVNRGKKILMELKK